MGSHPAPAWRMSLAGSELARIAWEGEDGEDGEARVLALHFAVAQVRPSWHGRPASRFGQGDDTAYLPGVVWRLSGVVVAAEAADAADADAVGADKALAAMLNQAPGRVSGGELRVAADGAGKLENPLAGRSELRSEVPLPAEFTTAERAGIVLRLDLAHGTVLTLRASGLRCALAAGPAGDAAGWPSLAC